MKMKWIIAAVFLVICAVTDIRKKEIPVVFIVLFGALSAVYVGISGEKDLQTVLYSLVPGALLLALSLCTGESIGYGDGLTVLVLGVLLGLGTCSLVVGAGLLASALCALLLLVCRKVSGKSRLPFVPFLTIGLGVVYFVQNGR